MTGTDATGTDATGTDRTGAEMIRAAEAQATEFSPPPPRPLYREVPEPEPFPAGALGPILGPAANAIHDIIQAPLAVCAQSVLASAALAAQACKDVELPYGGHRPLSLYLLCQLASGERKTATDALASKPIQQREAELQRDYKEAFQTYEAHLAAYESAWKGITNDKNFGPDEKKQQLLELGPKPEAPPSPIIVCGDPTFEGLFRLLQSGPRSVGIFSSEGGLLIGGHALNEDNRLKTAAGLSSGWDGDPWKRVRAGDKLAVLRNRRVTLNLMVQPQVSSRLIDDDLLRDQGLLSRLLVSAPTPASGSRLWKEPALHSREVLSRYSDQILQILRRASIDDDADFPFLVLTPEARRLWIGFADWVEKQLGPDGAMSSIAGLANKAAEHAARTAGVLAITEDPETSEIDDDKLSAGVQIIQFYLTEAMRLHETARIDSSLQRASRLLRWLHTSWAEPVISPVEVYQRGPREFRQRGEAAATMKILEEYAWVVPIEGVHVVAGEHRREVFRIVRG